MPYLSQRALQGLSQYEYKPAGYTWLDEWHTPYWNYAVERLPMWLAPNLITLTGMLFLVWAFVTAAVYVPDLEGDAPRWVYVLFAVSIFLYLNLDCIDGKQARRTNSSSPLGQLFDHGCDALSVHLAVTMVAVDISVGVNWKTPLGYLVIMGPWIAAHWEEYHTGVMLYGNGWWGVLEANYLMVALHLFTAAAGPGVWRQPLAGLLGLRSLPWPLDSGMLLSDTLILAMGACGLQQISGNVARVLLSSDTVQACPAQLPAAERGHKALGGAAAANHAAQLAVVHALGILALLQPCATPGQAQATYTAFGVIYALQATKLIMDHMAKEPFEIKWWPMLVLALLIANSRLEVVPPPAAAFVACGVVCAGYLHYVVYVIREICAHLNISCLTIKTRTQ